MTFRDLTGTLQHVGRTQTRAQAEGTKDIDSVGCLCSPMREKQRVCPLEGLG